MMSSYKGDSAVEWDESGNEEYVARAAVSRNGSIVSCRLNGVDDTGLSIHDNDEDNNNNNNDGNSNNQDSDDRYFEPIRADYEVQLTYGVEPIFSKDFQHSAAPNGDRRPRTSLLLWHTTLEAAYDASSPDELALVCGAKHLGRRNKHIGRPYNHSSR